MGLLDISKLNTKLQGIANEYDTDKDKKLVEAEYDNFMTNIRTNSEVTNEDYKEILGLSTSANATETTNTTTASTETKSDEKFTVKQARKLIDTYLDKLLKEGCNTENLKTKLDECLADNATDESFVKVKEEIYAVIAAMPKYESIADIAKKRQEAKKNLEKAGIRDAEHERILLKLEKFAKNQVIQESYDKINDQYGTITEENKDQTDEVTMSQIKSDLKSKNDFNLEERKAFKAYEKNVVMSNAVDLVDGTIEGFTGNEYTEWRKIHKEAIKTLKDNEKYDKYVRRAMKDDFGDLHSDYDAYGKQVAKQQANDNRVETKKTQSKQEFLKAIDNDDVLYAALHGHGLITVNNGQVDATKLSECIRQYSGADNTLNRNNKKSEAESEIALLKARLKAELELDELSDKDIKALAKACGYNVEGPNWKKILLDTLTGGLLGVAAGATSTAFTPNKTAVVEGATINFNQATTVDVVGAVVEQVTKGSIKLGDVIVTLAKDTASIMWPATLVGIAMGLAKGIENSNIEIPTLPRDLPVEDNIEDYLEGIEHLFESTEAKGYFDVVKCIAYHFYDPKTKEWDKVAYHKALRDMAGYGSPLNKKELVRGCKNLSENIEKEEKEKKEEPIEEEHTYCTDYIPGTEGTKVAVTSIDGSKTTWGKIAERYQCLIDEYGLSGAIRIIKIVQAITDGDYSKERIEELYNKSKKGLSAMKNIDGFNYDIYKNVLTAQELPKLIVKDGKAVEGTGVKVPATIAECDYDANVSLVVKVKNRVKATVRAIGHAVDYITTGGTNPQYALRFDCGDWNYFGTETERTQAIDAFKSVHKNAKEQRCEK